MSEGAKRRIGHDVGQAMKLSSLKKNTGCCLLYLARHECGTSLTIPEISQSEGISHHNVGKMLRILRQGGFVGERGQHGGYVLARRPNTLSLPMC